MIDRTHPLPVVRQCQLLEVARSTAYYQPTSVADAELVLMRRIDELHLQYPFAGARMLRDLLRQEGELVGRRHVATLMRRIGITAVYRKPCTTQRQPAHRIYPYLLRDLDIVRPNHVWASDITYIPMKRGFVYLFALLDWASRRVLAWRLSNTLTTDFCLDAMREAISHYGRPEMPHPHAKPAGHQDGTIAGQCRVAGRHPRGGCRTPPSGEHRQSGPQRNFSRFIDPLLSSMTANVAILCYF